MLKMSKDYQIVHTAPSVAHGKKAILVDTREFVHREVLKFFKDIDKHPELKGKAALPNLYLGDVFSAASAEGKYLEHPQLTQRQTCVRRPFSSPTQG